MSVIIGFNQVLQLLTVHFLSQQVAFITRRPLLAMRDNILELNPHDVDR
jgi:hypothetical protein